jgi:acyl-CoA thioesterase FadM
MKNCFRYLKLMSPLNVAICTTISYTLWVEYYLKNNYLTLRSKVKVPRRSLRYATHCLMVMHPHTKYNWPIWKDKKVKVRTRKYYLKNNYLTLRSKVKVPRRSLGYATHRLMVMHPHIKYNWPIWKDKKVMVRTSFAEKKQKQKKKSD